MASDSLSVRNLCAECADERGILESLNEFTYQFRPGYFYEIRGENPAGKNLLLQTLGLRVPATSGEIFVDGISLANLDLDELSDVRNRKFGFLFSAPFLLPAFTVLENVAMPLFKIAQVETPEAKLITEEILDMTGITEISDASIGELDALEQMLTALARAMIHHPRVLIAENVGNHLSEVSATQLLNAMRRCSQRLGVTVIATLADQISWQLSDVSLEVRPKCVEEFVRNKPHG
jgi:ABC-type lipoprotein export system ATPase subunit